MAAPVQVAFFAGVQADADSTAWNTTFHRTKTIELVLTNFSGMVTIQGGAISSSPGWVAVSYSPLSHDGAATFTNAPLQFVQKTGSVYYAVLDYWPQIRLSMTRATGTISANGYGHEGTGG